MAGIVGIYPFGSSGEAWRVSRFIYYGLLALQHRGQESLSIAVLGRGGVRILRRRGSLEDAVGEKDLEDLEGFAGVGMVSALEGDSVAAASSPAGLVLAGDGAPVLDGERGWRLFSQVLSDEIHRLGDPLRAASRAVEIFRGGYSFIALTEDRVMILGRDRAGVRPLEIGSMGFDLFSAASESCALDVMGMEHAGHVGAGEVVKVDRFGVERARVGSGEASHCSFEYVYLARPDSVINGVSVYKVRERIGEILARESPAEGDLVAWIPETSLPAAAGFSRSSGVPLSMGFVASGRRSRTAIRPGPLERLAGIQLKLNPVGAAVEGRSVILVDDSVVRGSTLKNAISGLKRRGASRVHVRIGSPPLRHRCPYGFEVPGPDELIASSLSEDEIAEIVNADSLRFLSTDGLVEAIGLPRESLCLRCWLGWG